MSARHIEFVPEHSTSDGATKLANRIANYWQQRGYPLIQVEVIKIRGAFPPNKKPSAHQDRKVFGVRSNIGPNGYPPEAVAA